MANTDNPNGFYPAYTLSGGPPAIKWVHAAASQTIAEGDAVIKNSAGDMNIALAGSSALYGVAAGAVVTTASDEQTLFPVYVFDKNTVFVGQCSGSSSMALEGDFVDIEGTTGIMEINEDAGSTKVLQLIGAYPADELGANGRMYFQCVKSQFQGTEVS